MTKHKYHDFDTIGPHNILMYYKYKKKNGKGYRGIFQCPYCGKSFEAFLTKIVTGNTTRCSLCTKERRRKLGLSHGYNLVGQHFGKLTVIDKAYSRRVNNRKTLVFWDCQCECGASVIVETNHLTRGHTQSCGCIKSYGEYRLAQILAEELKIEFEREKTFENLMSPYSHRLLRFDFYLPKLNCCIECDGVQHKDDYLYGSGFFSDKEKIKKIKKCDKIKNQYCAQNDIVLYRIPQKDYRKMDKEYVSRLLGEIG